MKLTLGGKISVTLAALWGASVAVTYFGSELLGHSVSQLFGLILLCLSFPLGWLGISLVHPHREGGLGPAYFFLMVPNFFLRGYTMAGLCLLFRKKKPSPTEVSAEELKKLLQEHRSHET
jgi:hypothetical protein